MRSAEQENYVQLESRREREIISDENQYEIE
jgi:hypothetical protein